MNSNKLLAVVLAASLGVAAGAAFILLNRDPHEFVGTVFANPDAAPAFELTADTGEKTTLDAYEDKVVLLYFGYTFCPDICPASLAELATAVANLDGAAREDVQVMMVSVDPDRDTPAVLREYMDHFDPDFVGLTGSTAEIATVAGDYNVFYQAHEGTAASGYLVDHWAGVYLIDREGRLVESFSFGTPGEQIALDLQEWL